MQNKLLDNSTTRLKEGQLTQTAAARALRISERWIRKKFKRFLFEGHSGLVHRSRGRPSPRAWSEAQKSFVLELFNETFQGFGPTFASEKLEELLASKLVEKHSVRP